MVVGQLQSFGESPRAVSSSSSKLGVCVLSNDTYSRAEQTRPDQRHVPVQNMQQTRPALNLPLNAAIEHVPFASPAGFLATPSDRPQRHQQALPRRRTLS